MSELNLPDDLPERNLGELKEALDDGGLQPSRIYPRRVFDDEARRLARCAAIEEMMAPVNGMSPFILYWMIRERDELVEGILVMARAAALSKDIASLDRMGFELCPICGGGAEVCSACMGNGARPKKKA